MWLIALLFIEITFAYIIGATCRGVINGVVVLLLCWILVPNFSIHNYALTLIYLFTVSWTFGALGVIIGIFAKSWDQIGSFTTFVFMPLSIFFGH